MRIFGDPMRTKRLLQMAGMKEGEVIESGMLTRQIEKAQRKVESHNFDIRKQLLLFDDVANDQRKVIYQQRTEIMGTADLSAAIRGILEEAIGTLVDQYLPKHAMPSDWDLRGARQGARERFQRARRRQGLARAGAGARRAGAARAARPRGAAGVRREGRRASMPS